eukprot:scaffold1387_cov382-Prasinococcus_capsulatus_cf.AAC.11
MNYACRYWPFDSVVGNQEDMASLVPAVGLRARHCVTDWLPRNGEPVGGAVRAAGPVGLQPPARLSPQRLPHGVACTRQG